MFILIKFAYQILFFLIFFNLERLEIFRLYIRTILPWAPIDNGMQHKRSKTLMVCGQT